MLGATPLGGGDCWGTMMPHSSGLQQFLSGILEALGTSEHLFLGPNTGHAGYSPARDTERSNSQIYLKITIWANFSKGKEGISRVHLCFVWNRELLQHRACSNNINEIFSRASS